MLTTSFFAWNCLLLFLGSAANEYQEVANTINEMTRTDKYQKYLRPNHRGDAVNVTVSIGVVHFVKLNEITEEFSMDLVIWQQWKDPRLNHSLSYPITLPGKFVDIIWLPDTFFINIRKAVKHDVTSENSHVSISPEGVVTYSMRITVAAGCAMDLTDYPLDEQRCDLELSTYSYFTEELKYTWAKGRIDDVIIVMDKNLAEHKLTDVEALVDLAHYFDGTYAKLVARFWFKRRTEFALIQIYFPIIMLVALSWLSFWIPEDAVPARVSLGSTTVLSVVTFTGSFRSSLPKVSYVNAVDVYFIVSFMFVFAVVVEYILVLLHTGFRRDVSKRNDLSIKGKDKVEDIAGDEELEEVKVETPMPVPKHRRRKIAPKPTVSFTVKEYVEYAFIRNEASHIDRICRYSFPCCYILFNLIYWTYYELEAFGHHI